METVVIVVHNIFCVLRRLWHFIHLFISFRLLLGHPVVKFFGYWQPWHVHHSVLNLLRKIFEYVHFDKMPIHYFIQYPFSNTWEMAKGFFFLFSLYLSLFPSFLFFSLDGNAMSNIRCTAFFSSDLEFWMMLPNGKLKKKNEKSSNYREL